MRTILLQSHELLSGTVCGLAVGLIYWTLTLPFCLLVVVCYTVPLVYITGRLLFHRRCRCLTTLPLSTDASPSRSPNLSDGVTSFETCCLLGAISGPDDHVTGNAATSGGCRRFAGTIKSALVGPALVVLMWSLLLLYSEAVGFAAEVALMTSVGVVLNPGSDAARRVVLVAWGLVYAVACYRAAVGTYTEFSRRVFTAMKGRLASPTMDCITQQQRGSRRRFTAFKYFGDDEEERHLAATNTQACSHQIFVMFIVNVTSTLHFVYSALSHSILSC